jgi:hypothetical protein
MPEDLSLKSYSVFGWLVPGRLVEYFRQSREWQSAKSVIRTHGFFIFLGAFGGLFLIALQEILRLKEGGRGWYILGLIMEHGGLGLVVSALAVFGYEWRSNAKKLFDLTEELVKLHEELLKLLEVQGIGAIRRGLEVVLGAELDNLPDNLKVVFRSLMKVIQAIQELNKNQAWANRQYIAFVSDLLDTCELNAVNLSQMENEKVTWTDFIVPVTASKLADKFLAKYMVALSSDDTYEVISDFTSWRGEQLKEFHDTATKQAVNNGAEVIRVFNLLSVRDEDISVEQVRDILGKHLKDASEWTGKEGYKVKVFGQEEFSLLRGSFPQDFPDKRPVMQHFGIFKHRAEIVCVMVREADLSKMQLCSKIGSVRTDVDKLEKIIAKAKPLKPELTEEGRTEQINSITAGLITAGIKVKHDRKRRRKRISE